MNVTIDEAMSALTVLQDSMNEEGFLYECLNMSIGALKTIKEGNFQINPCNIPRETLVKMAEYDCRPLSCGDCKYWAKGSEGYRVCFALKAKDILRHEQYIKEVAEWINKNSTN